jgi:hypothetical protein
MTPNLLDTKQSTVLMDEMARAKRDAIDKNPRINDSNGSSRNSSFNISSATNDITMEQKWEPRSRKSIFKNPRINNSNGNPGNSSFLNSSSAANASFLNNLTELKDRMIRRESVQPGGDTPKNSQKVKSNDSFKNINNPNSNRNISSKRSFLDVSKKMSTFAVNKFRLNSIRTPNNDVNIHEAPEKSTKEIVWTGLVPKLKEKKHIGSETETLLLKVVNSPISLGYFIAFCESEHNEEYIAFYVAVADLKTASGFDHKAVANQFMMNRSFDLDTDSKTENVSSGPEKFCAAIDKIHFTIEDRLLTKRSEKLVSKMDGMNTISETKISKRDKDNSFRDKTSTKSTKVSSIWNKYLNPIEANLNTFLSIPSSCASQKLAGDQHLYLSIRVLHNTLMRMRYVELS